MQLTLRTKRCVLISSAVALAAALLAAPCSAAPPESAQVEDNLSGHAGQRKRTGKGLITGGGILTGVGIVTTVVTLVVHSFDEATSNAAAEFAGWFRQGADASATTGTARSALSLERSGDDGYMAGYVVGGVLGASGLGMLFSGVGIVVDAKKDEERAQGLRAAPGGVAYFVRF
jgi:hypothetical protein